MASLLPPGLGSPKAVSSSAQAASSQQPGPVCTWLLTVFPTNRAQPSARAPALVLPDVSRCWAPTGASPLVGSQALPPAARFPSTLNSSNEGCLGCRAPTKCMIRPSPSPMGHHGTPPRYTLPSLEGSAGSANARALVHSSTAEQLPAGALGLVCNAEAQYQRTGQATRARERAGLTPVPAQALWS